MTVTDRCSINQRVAAALEEVARLLELQSASIFRVQAYRRAANTVRAAAEAVDVVLQEGGLAALEEWPAIGRSLAGAISELVQTGTLGLLERLRGRATPEDLLATIPGIGEVLAHRIHEQLGVDTLEQLELAAHDGRLLSVRSIGVRRLAALQGLLAARLSRSTRRRAQPLVSADASALELDLFGQAERPPVSMLLSVDSEYRRKARLGHLRRIAPKRFNPAGNAWLPVLHTERADWSLQAMFSNTARAHQLRKTGDWVVIYYDSDGHQDQVTVVTERRGDLAGKRVVRGLESECRALYASRKRGSRQHSPHSVRHNRDSIRPRSAA
jgi:hypothetical protein